VKAKPENSKVTPYVIPEKTRLGMERLRNRVPRLRAEAESARQYRNTPDYLKAMEILARDLGVE
jgi:hypothetical protein